jgi:SNF2 family DNA or RNA helicase
MGERQPDMQRHKPCLGARAEQRKTQRQSFDSLHDQWLHALRSVDGRLEGEPEELAKLADQIREWRRPVSVATTSPFKLCFRLEEPEAPVEDEKPQNDGTWQVRYLLQGVDDPSLLVPADEASTSGKRRQAVLTRPGFNAREFLLLSLGRASTLCPRIEASLKQAVPGGYGTDATGAYEFLTEKAFMLEQAGFGVLLPAWWTRKGTKLRLTARASVNSPKLQADSGLSLDSVVQFQWEIALGDEKLSLNELEELARLKAPLVRVRGQWVQMSADEIQAALDFWKNKGQGEARVREIIQMSLGSGTAGGPIPFEGVQAGGWVGDLLAQLDGRSAFEEIQTPDAFQGTLRPYQCRGYSWLAFLRRWGLGACLADDMGLGKTIQTLALIQRDWHADGKRPVLLICPTSVVGNWQKEAARFTPELPVMVHHGTGRTKDAAFTQEAAGHAIVISSYPLLHRDFEVFKRVDWAGVVLDEAQNIKNPETKQAKAARSISADYRVALTGTPVENNVGDLWSIIEFLNPGLLGTQTEFKRTFFVPIQAQHDPDAVQRLKRVTGPFILRRLKTDKSIIADLPDKLEMKVFCNLTKEQASLYAAVVKEVEGGLDSAEGIQRKGLILATLSKLKQVCNHPAQFLGDNSAIPGRSGKVARLAEMLEEMIAVGDRALVFTQFAEMGELLRKHLQDVFGREVLFLHGRVPKKHRDSMVERFQADDQEPIRSSPEPRASARAAARSISYSDRLQAPSIFILSLKAGGTGLNLTRANHVFHFDRWWNPAVENQATDRAFRIGQTRNVQVHKFLCVGTLEEKIDEMIERKKEVAEKVIGTGEGWLTELSTAELKELFALREEAVA